MEYGQFKNWQCRRDSDQKRQIALNKEARLRIVEKKTQASIKVLQEAQKALEKYQANENFLNNSDWGDVVRWVLPAAKVEFLLKDLKRKEQIVAKLATLPNAWVTYIPNATALPVVAVTTV